MNTNYSVSIIIPHLKDKKILDECIKSIIENTNNIKYEIIVVDNNCQDESIKYIKKTYSEVKIIESKYNRGYAGGCNMGAKNATGDFLLFLNNDTILTPNCVNELLNKINKNETIASVQPKIKNYFNQKLFDYAGASGGYIDYLGFPFARGRILNTIEQDNGQYDSEEKIFWASGTAFMTQRKIFNQMEGFDESLFAHMEEIDYHWKCLLNGYEIYVNPQSLIYHKGGQTLAYGSYKKIYLNHRNSMILFLTNNQKNSFSKIIKRIILEKIAFIYYIMKLNFKGALAIFNANMWLLLNMKYLIERKQKIKKLIKIYHPISNQLIRDYSIIKKYFYNKKTKFNQLD
tara:strand:- start:6833 stop:7867 length:1035 start_codon:yes stop_codon:yes gene_type:complete